MPGYYNLPPGNSFEDLTIFEKSLRSLPSEGAKDALDLLETLARNIIQNPAQEKFRRVRTTNEKLSPLFGAAGALNIMQEMGWHVDGEFVVLPKEVKLDFPNHIVKILEAKSYYAKQESIKRGSAKLGRDPAKAGLLKQLEADRRERSAAGTTNLQPYSKPTAQAAPYAADAVEVVRAEVPDCNDVLHEWACPSCTLLNQASRDACEMCETGRPQLVMPPAGDILEVVPTKEAPCIDAPEVSPNNALCSSPESADQQPEVEGCKAVHANPESNANPEPCAAAFVGDAPAPTKASQPAPQFEPPQRRPKAENKDMSLQELRALQKNKFNDFKADPTSAQSEAYQRPPSSCGAQAEAGWFDWMWGGSSSSNGSSGGGGRPSGPPAGGKRMKTIADLPKPVARGGG